MDVGTNPAVLWSQKTGRAEFEFIQGEFETTDPDLIEKLKAMGYYYLSEDGSIVNQAQQLGAKAMQDYELRRAGTKQPIVDDKEEAEEVVATTPKPIKVSRKPGKKGTVAKPD